MNMNNASASSGRQAAAYDEPVLKVGLSAWRSCKLFHAVLCEVKTAWRYESCREACIVSSERRWHKTQWWFCTFEAQQANMILSALTQPVMYLSIQCIKLYDVVMIPPCMVYECVHTMVYLAGCCIGKWRAKQEVRGIHILDSNSTGGQKNNSKQRSAGCGSRQLFANTTLNSLTGLGICADGR